MKQMLALSSFIWGKGKVQTVHEGCHMYITSGRYIVYITVYDRIFGDFPAQKAAYTPHIWSWPTLDTHYIFHPCMQTRNGNWGEGC